MRRRILIVDDALADRRSLEGILAEAGHAVLSAESGEEAIERARTDRPDVILMDVNMPDLDGFATTRRLKADDATKDIPVVFVTGKHQKADIAWGRMLGARGYVGKPYTREDILAQLQA
ncbi:MAG TPA: response regulator [Ramlibacter sp.]|uniref:response regulator n=1 Tax=Ramlibacter sp. TaxID=1917967 RepID=UPI002D056134|nr:response regulator [Ramlibacter sp.]HVZ46055.1 response regulator [Ramlibacter sp.]